MWLQNADESLISIKPRLIRFKRQNNTMPKSKLTTLLASLIPRFVLGEMRLLQQRWKMRGHQNASNKEIFAKIYSTGAWGKDGDYCSGSGSVDPELVGPYCTWISSFLGSLPQAQRNVVDIGCGDFRVAQTYAGILESYIGIDVVDDLVVRNRRLFGAKNIAFRNIDVCLSEIPAGDVAIARQILQHMSNQEILVVLRKLRAFEWVVITEHLPSSENSMVKKNRDKPRGAGIRLYHNSGVYPDEAPFNWPKERCTIVLEQSVKSEFGLGIDRGVLRTYLLRGGF